MQDTIRNIEKCFKDIIKEFSAEYFSWPFTIDLFIYFVYF